MEKYFGAFIAMTVLACVFLLVLVVIVVIWCKGRRKVEVKTVTIQPKKKSAIITKAVRQTNGESRAPNGSTSKSADDEEAIVGAEEINLEPVEPEVATVDEVNSSTADNKQESTETPAPSEAADQSEADKQQDDQSHHSNENISQSREEQPPADQSEETEKPDDETEKVAEDKKEVTEEQGHSNPTFQDDETDQS